MKKYSTKLSLSNFTFVFSGFGHYRVTFFSTLTNKSWFVVTTDMPLIDLTKNCDNPTQINLIRLKRLCKSQKSFL